MYYAKLSVKVCDFVRILWDLFLRPAFVASSPGDRHSLTNLKKMFVVGLDITASVLIFRMV